MGYLNEWDRSVNGCTGFTAAERKRIRLSDETLEGLSSNDTGIYSQIIVINDLFIVKSFLEMARARFLLQQPGVKFLLSERFCQDPLEAFFGHQRARGGIIQQFSNFVRPLFHYEFKVQQH